MKKVLTVIWTIGKFILWTAVIAFLIVVLVQRVTNNKKAVAGLRLFTIITESMVPEYNVGDSIIVKEYVSPADIQVGDDVTYMGKEGTFKGKIVTHRVLKVEKNEDGTYTILTKGIANDEEDPLIKDSQVYGKVIKKMLIITKINSVTGNLYGMYFAIFVPLGLLFFFEMVVFRRDAKKMEEESEDEEDKENEKDKKNNRFNKEIKKDKNGCKEEKDNEEIKSKFDKNIDGNLNKQKIEKTKNDKEIYKREKNEYTDEQERMVRKEKRNKRRSKRRNKKEND